MHVCMDALRQGRGLLPTQLWREVLAPSKQYVFMHVRVDGINNKYFTVDNLRKKEEDRRTSSSVFRTKGRFFGHHIYCLMCGHEISADALRHHENERSPSMSISL